MNINSIKLIFFIAALYDGILGIAFILFPGDIFAFYQVEPPNHMAYVQFPALLLIVFSVMFIRIALNPIINRELILYGCGLKISYVATAFWYQITTGIPFMWVPWAWIDLVMLFIFIMAWLKLNRLALSG